MTNAATMPAAQGAVIPGAAAAATGKGGRSDLLFGDLLAVAVDGPVIQQPGAGRAVPDELASVMAMFMPMNLTSSVATVRQPATAGSQPPIAMGPESPIPKAGVAIDPADVLARLIQPATPGATQDAPVLSGQAKLDSFRAVLDQLTPTARGDSPAVQAPAGGADPKGTVPVTAVQTPRALDPGVVGPVTQSVVDTSDTTVRQATTPEATVRQPAIAGSQTPIATGSEPPIPRSSVVIDPADLSARPIQPATPGVTQDAPVHSGQAQLGSFGAVLDQLTPATSGDPGAVQLPATGADPKGTASEPAVQMPKAPDLGAVGQVTQPVVDTSESTVRHATTPEATVRRPATAGSQIPIAMGPESPIPRAGVVIDPADVQARPIQPATSGVAQDAPVLSGQAKHDSFRAVLDQLTPTTSRDPVAVAPVTQSVVDTSDSTVRQATSPHAAVHTAVKTDGANHTDAKPAQASAGEAPPEAFMVARQPAHDAGETRPLDTTRQVMTAKLTAERPGERVVSTVQTDSQPAGDNGASTQDNARSAASMLARAEPFHQVMTEATATRTGEAVRMDTDLSRRVIDQVVRQVSFHRLDGRTDMVVKLNPPDLGTLRLHVIQDAHGMTSQIQTTNEQVRGLLQAHLPALVDALSGVGVKLNSVSVTSDPSFGALMHNSAQGGNQQQPDVPRRQFAGLPGDIAGTISSTGLYDAPSNGVGYSWLA